MTVCTYLILTVYIFVVYVRVHICEECAFSPADVCGDQRPIEDSSGGQRSVKGFLHWSLPYPFDAGCSH